jgi:hypothetical protein
VLPKETFVVRGESLQEAHVGAHQPIKLRAGFAGQGGEGILQPSLGVAVEVPLARETAPASEEGQGNHLALGEGGLRAGPLFGGREWQKSSAIT